MKAVILAGGFGTRLSEETALRPKPMVEIGGKPILWHIMKIYSTHGINDFIICLGYKGYVIKEFFLNYTLNMSDLNIDLRQNQVEYHKNGAEPWKVSLIDTGEKTMTGGRLKRIRQYLENETFCMTYGDGVSDVNVTESIRFHKQQNAVVTLTAVQSPGRFGAFTLNDGQQKIPQFREKPLNNGAYINGGFFVMEPPALDYIKDDTTVWERTPLEKLSHEGKLAAYRHFGFWHPMDTLRDKNVLEDYWTAEKAPWKIW
ncbi:MAG: glucose-1-phosphate cytidylyltransferase [Candidatus Lokiarchaeota archaeon]|nr:glucose-1-phosphate cytidylyltransferase [Candidatus Lokiarchaeota archaeon]